MAIEKMSDECRIIKAKEAQKRYKLKNREIIKEKQKAYRQSPGWREYHREKMAEWRKEKPEKAKEISHRYLLNRKDKQKEFRAIKKEAKAEKREASRLIEYELRGGKKICTKCRSEKCESEFGKDKHKWDGLHIYCKECANILSGAREREYRKRFPERVKQSALKDKLKNGHKIRERQKRLSKENTKMLGDSYIKKIIIRTYKFMKDRIPKDIIELKKENIKLKREIKNKNNDKS